MKLLKVDNICKEYPGFRLQNVSFAIESGTIMGFIGRNGAGKTTVLKSIMNMVHTTAGKVEFFGLDLVEHENAIKQRIGYAGGAVDYYKKKKISELIRITKRFYENWDDAVCRKYMDLFSLDENKTPSELSEGMKVKLNLVIALSHGAELLILDEPTSGLDPATATEIQELIRAERQKGNTIFLTTHNMAEAEKLCDHVALLNEGTIVEYGEPQEICRRYNHQKKVRLHLTDGSNIELPHNETVSETLNVYFSQGIVETIHSTEPNLETVFMELTGRKLE